jgi:hypothetical protein
MEGRLLTPNFCDRFLRRREDGKIEIRLRSLPFYAKPKNTLEIILIKIQLSRERL